MAYLMYVSAALTHLWAIYAPQNQYWITKPCRSPLRCFVLNRDQNLMIIWKK